MARRDEMLELLYWIEGEGFGGAAGFAEIVRFLALPEDAVRRTLADLIARGEIAHDDVAGDYRLTERGRREGARRFAEEFAPLLAQGHGECNDPDCGCHSDPSSAAECHSRRRGTA
jgi:DNA-binding IclR family transcriptional regulator